MRGGVGGGTMYPGWSAPGVGARQRAYLGGGALSLEIGRHLFTARGPLPTCASCLWRN